MSNTIEIYLQKVAKMKTDILIVGSGCSGLYCALNLPREKQITIITKSDVKSSDSYLAQGGICMLKDDSDYDSYFEDTMKAGHYENDRESVSIMIRSSQDVIHDLIGFGVDFAHDENGNLAFTREGAHSDKRILFHEDITGEEITSNFRHLTGDALALSIKHGIRLKDVNYVQIHPTTFYSPDEEERSFLISESVRGEGAKLYDKNMKRFVNELLPRDLLAEEIYKQMAKDGTDHVWEDLRTIPREELMEHFPNIVEHCREMGYDVTKECIPVVPAQHYFMGGVWVDHESHTSMERLYAVGETACNGVHGKNRLASNSLLESLVFAKRAAKQMSEQKEKISTAPELFAAIDRSIYADAAALASRYHEYVREAIIAADAKMQQVQDARTKATVAFRKQCAQVG